MTNYRDKIEIIESLHNQFGRKFFTLSPYIKFLPLIFFPPSLNWDIAGPCARKSNLVIAIPVFGLDNIAWHGWYRFARIAVFTLLCLPNIKDYAIQLLIGKYQPELPDNHIISLFGTDITQNLTILDDFNVKITDVQGLLTTTNIYDFCDKDADLIIRCDADNGFQRKSLSSDLFAYQAPLGESGMNFRLTHRSGLEELFHPQDGRMLFWEKPYRRELFEFLQTFCSIINNVFRTNFTTSSLKEKLENRPWPSAGLSYLKKKILPEYIRFRDAVQKAGLAPWWDEEILQLLISCVFDFIIESCKAPVVDYWETEYTSGHNAIVHFGNMRQIGKIIDGIFNKNHDFPEYHFTYILEFLNNTMNN